MPVKSVDIGLTEPISDEAYIYLSYLRGEVEFFLLNIWSIPDLYCIINFRVTRYSCVLFWGRWEGEVHGGDGLVIAFWHIDVEGSRYVL